MGTQEIHHEEAASPGERLSRSEQIFRDQERSLAEHKRLLAAARRELEAKSAENERLRAALQAATAELASRQTLIQSIVNNVPAVIWAKTRDGRHILANKAFERFHASRGPCLGKTDYDLFPEEMADDMRAQDRAVFEEGAWLRYEETLPCDGATLSYETCKFPIQDAHGKTCALGAIAVDITERKRTQEELVRMNDELRQKAEAQRVAEAERAALQAQVIEAQRAVLRELSAPLIPLSSSVLLLPLLGTIDAQRAAQATETLLRGIEQHRAAFTILDLTGARGVDAGACAALIRAAKGARMLGARVILTGIQPRIAQTLIDQGIDLQGIIILATLQAGIKHAIRS